MKLNFKDLLNRPEFYVTLSFFIAIFVILIYIFFTPNFYSHKSPVEFDINRNEPLSNISKRLYEEGLIPSETNFKIAAFIYGAERRIRAARFHIPNGLSYLGLLDLLISGKCDFARTIRISDGQTIKWLAYKLEHKVFIDSAMFVQRANDTSFIKKLGLNEKSLEGYLFSKKYQIYQRSTPEEALTIFYKGFKDFFADSLKQRAKELGLSVHELLTLASIIKGETNKKDEMARIAGVYHNRLMKGMRLQADPTIQYLLPGGWRRLLYEDLEIDSPYNTYKYTGLPPGPINNPGKSAILAALYPEQNKYLYFVADGKGGHKFARTYNQHIRNVNEYRRWLRSQKMK